MQMRVVLQQKRGFEQSGFEKESDISLGHEFGSLEFGNDDFDVRLQLYFEFVEVVLIGVGEDLVPEAEYDFDASNCLLEVVLQMVSDDVADDGYECDTLQNDQFFDVFAVRGEAAVEMSDG